MGSSWFPSCISGSSGQQFLFIKSVQFNWKKRIPEVTFIGIFLLMVVLQKRVHTISKLELELGGNNDRWMKKEVMLRKKRNFEM